MGIKNPRAEKISKIIVDFDDFKDL